eukprot:4621515-Prymnesium_polylepis.2
MPAEPGCPRAASVVRGDDDDFVTRGIGLALDDTPRCFDNGAVLQLKPFFLGGVDEVGGVGGA